MDPNSMSQTTVRYPDEAKAPVDSPEHVGNIHQQIDRLDTFLDQLEQRLHPVLSPYGNEAQPVGPSSPTPELVESMISGAHSRLQARIDRLGAITRRIEA